MYATKSVCHDAEFPEDRRARTTNGSDSEKIGKVCEFWWVWNDLLFSGVGVNGRLTQVEVGTGVAEGRCSKPLRAHESSF